MSFNQIIQFAEMGNATQQQTGQLFLLPPLLPPSRSGQPRRTIGLKTL